MWQLVTLSTVYINTYACSFMYMNVLAYMMRENIGRTCIAACTHSEYGVPSTRIISLCDIASPLALSCNLPPAAKRCLVPHTRVNAKRYRCVLAPLPPLIDPRGQQQQPQHYLPHRPSRHHQKTASMSSTASHRGLSRSWSQAS